MSANGQHDPVTAVIDHISHVQAQMHYIKANGGGLGGIAIQGAAVAHYVVASRTAGH